MRITIVTLFPEMFTGVLGESILKRAIENSILQVELINFREFATDRHRTVDDYSFGGGAGMLLKPEPLFAAMDDLRSRDGDDAVLPSSVVLLSPQGRTFSQAVAKELAQQSHVVLLCGHYEGFDERVRDHLATDEISLGDFVMTGGEIAAMAIVDAVTRLLPGTLGNSESAETDSFASGLLEYPQYTRPAGFREWPVPDVLLSGDHGRIAVWRHRQALFRTWNQRPELLTDASLSAADRILIEAWTHGDFGNLDV